MNKKGSKILVVVESGGKIKKIEDILNSMKDGNKYKVFASVGHLMDLKKKGLSVDIENDFKPVYEIIEEKRNIIDKLLNEYEKVDEVLIASDPDREGEKIGDTIAQILKLKKPKRVTFNPITHDEVEKAIKKPRDIDYDLVHAQEARRVLDRIVGYPLSGLLMNKLGMGNLSAGRVQSVVQRLIVEKEEDIKAFLQKDINSFFITEGIFKYNKKEMNATLFRKNEQDIEEEENGKDIEEEEKEEKGKAKIVDVIKAKNILEKCSKSTFRINDIEEKEGKRNPTPPFTTSTLQQEASRKIGSSIKKTMASAQILYEAGHITYMRTDSVNLSEEAIKNIGDFIIKTFGKEYHRAVHYKSKSANTQEAHEAIRPTNVYIPNLKIVGKITEDENRLYKLIWKRAVASQMTTAIIKTNKIYIEISKVKEYQFISKTETIKFMGFLKIYGVEQNDEIEFNAKIGDKVEPKEITMIQKYDKPPNRYNEATLLEVLKPENLNIGRPSTYASIIDKIVERGYIIKGDIEGIEKDILIMRWNGKKIEEKKEKIQLGKDTNRFYPTTLGIMVNNFLIENFADLMDYEFTAKMENQLDEIAEGKTTYIKTLNKFYKKFKPELEKTKNVKKEEKFIGKHTDGDEIYAYVGRYGNTLRKYNTKTKKNIYGKILEPLTIENITLDDAIKLFEYPKLLGKIDDRDIFLNKGKFGLYLKYDGSNYGVPEDIKIVTLRNAINIIKNLRKNILWEGKDKTNKYVVLNGQYGKYISIKNIKTKKGRNIKLSPNEKIEDLTIEKIIEMAKHIKPKRRFFNKKKN